MSEIETIKDQLRRAQDLLARSAALWDCRLGVGHRTGIAEESRVLLAELESSHPPCITCGGRDFRPSERHSDREWCFACCRSRKTETPKEKR